MTTMKRKVCRATTQSDAGTEKCCRYSCGAPVAPFIPRWGMSWACVLLKGHEGEHQRGGNCFKHGEYVGENCPRLPDCIPSAAAHVPEGKLVEAVERVRELPNDLDRAARNLHEAAGLLSGHSLQSAVYDSSSEALLDSEEAKVAIELVLSALVDAKVQK